MALRLDPLSACRVQNYNSGAARCGPEDFDTLEWEFSWVIVGLGAFTKDYKWRQYQGDELCDTHHTPIEFKVPVDAYASVRKAQHGMFPEESPCDVLAHFDTVEHGYYHFSCVNCLDFCATYANSGTCPAGCPAIGIYSQDEKWCEASDNITPWSFVSDSFEWEADVYDPRMSRLPGHLNDPGPDDFNICTAGSPGAPCGCPVCLAPAQTDVGHVGIWRPLIPLSVDAADLPASPALIREAFVATMDAYNDAYDEVAGGPLFTYSFSGVGGDIVMDWVLKDEYCDGAVCWASGNRSWVFKYGAVSGHVESHRTNAAYAGCLSKFFVSGEIWITEEKRWADLNTTPWTEDRLTDVLLHEFAHVVFGSRETEALPFGGSVCPDDAVGCTSGGQVHTTLTPADKVAMRCLYGDWP